MIMTKAQFSFLSQRQKLWNVTKWYGRSRSRSYEWQITCFPFVQLCICSVLNACRKNRLGLFRQNLTHIWQLPCLKVLKLYIYFHIKILWSMTKYITSYASIWHQCGRKCFTWILLLVSNVRVSLVPSFISSWWLNSLGHFCSIKKFFKIQFWTNYLNSTEIM